MSEKITGGSWAGSASIAATAALPVAAVPAPRMLPKFRQAQRCALQGRRYLRRLFPPSRQGQGAEFSRMRKDPLQCTMERE
jgi:hypothetical protein